MIAIDLNLGRSALTLCDPEVLENPFAIATSLFSASLDARLRRREMRLIDIRAVFCASSTCTYNMQCRMYTCMTRVRWWKSKNSWRLLTLSTRTYKTSIWIRGWWSLMNNGEWLDDCVYLYVTVCQLQAQRNVTAKKEVTRGFILFGAPCIGIIFLIFRRARSIVINWLRPWILISNDSWSRCGL